MRRCHGLLLVLAGAEMFAAESGGIRLDAPQEALADGSQSLATVSLSGQDPKSRADLVGAPIPFYNPALGAGLGGFLGYLFPLDRTDRVSPPSAIGLGGFATDNGSWGVVAGHVGYADQDSRRWTVVSGYSELTYRYYGTGYEEGASNQEIAIDQQISFGLVEGLWRVAPNWYVGPRAMVSHSEASLHHSAQTGNAVIDDFLNQDLVSTAISPGIHLQFDSRDSTFSPGTGSLLDVVVMVSPQALGSTTSYSATKMAANHYLRLTPSQVLALRVAGKYASDDAPFYVLPTAGGTEGLRGYVPGQYRDHLLVSGQGEWRWMMFRSLGLTAFAGVAAVGEDVRALNDHPLLPAGGAGLLWRLSDTFPISMRLDGAWGRDSQTIYFSVGEAF